MFALSLMLIGAICTVASTVLPFAWKIVVGLNVAIRHQYLDDNFGFSAVIRVDSDHAKSRSLEIYAPGFARCIR